MKVKLNKKTVLIVGVACFLIALGILSAISFQKAEQRDQLQSQLNSSQTRLQVIKPQLSSEPAELQSQLDLVAQNLDQTRARLSEPVNSTNATAAIFEAARAFGLAVAVTTSSSTTNETMDGVPLSAFSMTTTVQGNLSRTVDFVAALNNLFRTSSIKSVQMTVADNTTPVNGDNTTSIIELVVYSYRGE